MVVQWDRSVDPPFDLFELLFQHPASAAMLAAVPAGGSPADGGCPAAIVVILGDEKGDRLVGSLGVNVSVGRVESRSDPPGRQANRQAAAQRTDVAPKLLAHVKRIAGCRECRTVRVVRRPASPVKELGVCSRRTLRGRGEWHVETERAAKARNHSSVAEALPHSEGSAYKPQSGEIALCRRVGRMGPGKC
jgi:hypothetical protein